MNKTKILLMILALVAIGFLSGCYNNDTNDDSCIEYATVLVDEEIITIKMNNCLLKEEVERMDEISREEWREENKHRIFKIDEEKW